MSLLSAREIAELVRTTESSFNDTCTIHVLATPIYNSYGEEILTYADVEDVPCGFSSRAEQQTERGATVTLDADAVLRLSLDQGITEKDEVTCRGARFTVDGVIDGRTARIVSLKQISTA